MRTLGNNDKRDLKKNPGIGIQGPTGKCLGFMMKVVGTPPSSLSEDSGCELSVSRE